MIRKVHEVDPLRCPKCGGKPPPQAAFQELLREADPPAGFFPDPPAEYVP